MNRKLCPKSMCKRRRRASLTTCWAVGDGTSHADDDDDDALRAAGDDENDDGDGEGRGDKNSLSVMVQ